MPSHPDRVRRHYDFGDLRFYGGLVAAAKGIESAPPEALKDKALGISIRFVQQYDVEKDKTPRCIAASHGYLCDREAGHKGSHRSYDMQVDEPVFWTTAP